MTRLLVLVSLLGPACATSVGYRIDGVATHGDQLVVVATRTVRAADGTAMAGAQTVNACELADEGDRLVCRQIGVEFDAPLPPLGLGYRDSDNGPEVTRVSEGGLAAGAGLALGDVIAAIDGKPVAEATALRAALEAAGRNVALSIRRGTEVVTVRIRR